MTTALMIQFRLEEARPDDFAALFAMRSDPDDIRWSGYPGPPDREQFQRWFHQKLIDRRGRLLIGFSGDTHAAYVNFSPFNNSIAVSYGVAAGHRRAGFGSNVLILATIHMSALGFSRYQAWISTHNKASEKVAAKAGFKPTETTVDQTLLFPEKLITRRRLWVGKANCY